MNGPLFVRSLFVDRDADGTPTVWRAISDRPDRVLPIVRKCDVSDEAWDLVLAGLAARAALVDWDTWNPSHGSYREAATDLRELIAETSAS